MKERKPQKIGKVFQVYDLTEDEIITFKVKCAMNKQSISEVLKEFIKTYTKEGEQK